MTPRRILLGAAAAAFLVTGLVAAPAGAGVTAPADMIATPNTGPVGQHVVISNASNSPCGGQEGDGPAQVDASILRPNGDVDEVTVFSDDATGDWSIGYVNTDLVGDYVVEATCVDVNIPNGGPVTAATDFDYTDVTFVITADGPTTTPTTAAPTTSTAAPAPAVAATAAFTG